MGNEWAPVVALSVFALAGGTAVVLRGPVGHALAEWIRSWATPEHKAMEAQVAVAYAPRGKGQAAVEVAELRAEVDELRQRLAEAEERLDFTERMLAKAREPERLGPGKVG